MKYQNKKSLDENHFHMAEDICRLINDFAINYLEQKKNKVNKSFFRYFSYFYHLFTVFKLKKHGAKLHSLCISARYEDDFIEALLKIDNDLFIKSKLRHKLRKKILDLLIERKSALIFSYVRMPHVICSLKGGLGNQLFQIATAVGTGLDFTLVTDDASHFAGQGSHPRKYYDNLYAKIPKKTMKEFQRIRSLPYDTQSSGQSLWLTYNEKGFAYRDLSSAVATCIRNDLGLQLNGYFQSERYFETRSAVIKELLTPEGGLISTVRATTNLFTRFPELNPETSFDGLTNESKIVRTLAR